MTTSPRTILVLGASGRVGRLLRHLEATGRWPIALPPVWQTRRAGEAAGAVVWDMTGPPPGDARLQGPGPVLCLAGPTRGPELDANTACARAAIDLAAATGRGPVLLASSVAVYGREPGPHAEDGPVQPDTAYGAAKHAMERAVAGTGAVCLRIANVAGASALHDSAAAGPVALDRLADGSSPRRAWIGPVSLLRAVAGLDAAHLAGQALPPVLNLANPGMVSMAEMLRAAGLDWTWRDAPATVLPEMAVETGRLGAILALPPATAEALAAEARAAGWRAAR